MAGSYLEHLAGRSRPTAVIARAEVPEKIRNSWGRMIETHLGERETLRLVVLILDIRWVPSPEDRQLIG